MARIRNKLTDFFGTFILLGAMAIGSAWLAKLNEVELTGSYKIIDGDSLFLGNREIRLIGIDAPEYRQICQLENGVEYPCGRQSRSHLEKLAKSGALKCTGSEEDKYQRLLAICMSGGIELNEQMVKDGWAVSFGDYYDAEASASENKNGVWQGGFESPKAWRANKADAHSTGWLSKFLPW